jgi:hypothetical protein
MQQRVPWLRVVLALCVVAGMAATAMATYVRPTGKPPTDADMVMIGGRGNVLAIRILNLTPYDIVEDPANISAKANTNTSRSSHQSFTFAPVGWPVSLPALDGSWYQDTGTNAWEFKPTNPNTQVHPYSFAVAWDEQGAYVTDSKMGLLIKNV